MLTFNEEITTAYIGNITLAPQGGTAINIPITSTQVTGEGTSTITINPTDDLLSDTNYEITIPATVFGDVAGNAYAGTTTNITTVAAVDITRPTAQLRYSLSSTGNDSVTEVESGNRVFITVTFNEDIAATPAMQISGSGVQTINATNMLREPSNARTYYYIWSVGSRSGTQKFRLSQGTDLAGNTVVSEPTSGGSIVVTGDTAGTSSVSAKKSPAAKSSTSTTVFVDSVSTTSGQPVTIVSSGDKNNSIWFAPEVTVSFVESATMTQAAGDAASIYAPRATGTYKLFVLDSSTNVLTTSTASLTVTPDATFPELVSSIPANGVTGISVDNNIVLTFSEAMTIGSGNITITGSATQNNIEISSTQTISVTNTSTEVTGEGSNQITINPSEDLLANARYTITIPIELFTDLAGNAYNGEDVIVFTTSAITSASNPAATASAMSSIKTQAATASAWTAASTNAIAARMTWLRHNRGSNNLSYQGIRIGFADQIFNKFFNTQVRENNQFTQERLAGMAKTLAYNNDNNGTSMFDTLKQEIADRAANEFAKLKQDIFGNLVALNPTGSISDTWAIWSAGNITLGNLDAQDIFTRSISFGLDRYLDNRKYLFGVAVSLGVADNDIDTTNIESDAYSFSVYSAFERDNNTTIEGLVGISRIDANIQRYLSNNNALIEGKRDINQIFASLTFRGNFKKQAMKFSPYGRVNASYTRLSDYAESGFGALAYDRQTINNMILYTGLDVDYLIRLNKGTLRPYGVIEYGVDISLSSTAELYYLDVPNTKYTITTEDKATHNLKFGAGLEYKSQNGAYVSAGYERTEAIDSGHLDSFDLELGLEF